MSVPLPYTVIDVFTSAALQGNQLGVFTDARALSPAQMQRLTWEMNFAECVFVLPAEQGGDARIRIFTPAQELPFAGHPVLGAAFVIGEPLRAPGGEPLATVHLARHGRIAFGDEIEVHQGEEIGRASVLYARAQGTAAALERVEVGGSAVVVARGEFHRY
jgi:predicted PhzF superfamily epimerase YddE/YHI9